MSSTVATTRDPILARLRSDLRAEFGERIERLVLYGSRARGDADVHSDYDVAVFLRAIEDRWSDMGRLAIIETRVFDDTGAMVHAMPLRAEAWTERTGFMAAVRRDGIDL